MEVNVNSVIDNICNKIGTTADILVPELARYKEYSYLAGFIICIICIAVSTSFIWIGKKLAEIEQMSSELTADGRRMIRRESVFRIIDKYRTGSEKT